MLRILHVSPGLKPGGTSQLCADTACALQEAGSANMVVSPANELVSRMRAAGVEHRLCRRPTLLNALQEARKLRHIIERFKPDVVQVYSPAACWVANTAIQRLPSSQHPLLVGYVSAVRAYGVSARLWKRCAGLIVISSSLRESLQNGLLKHRKKDIAHIPYGIDAQQCNPAFCLSADKWAQWRAAHPESAGKLTLCIPGAMSPLHGLEDIIPILTALMMQGIDVHAYIAGDPRKADSAYTDLLKKKFAISNLSEHISWIGARPDLREVLCACDMTLSLCKQPAICDRPVLEALALGRPVIGYDHGIVGELLESFLPEGAVAPGDTAAVADIIAQWNTYRPQTITQIPYPFRLSDTAESCIKLYRMSLPQ